MTTTRRIAAVLLRSAAGATLLSGAAPAFADTPAGTAIVNVAQLSYIADGRAATVASNEQRTIVAERLDVALAGGAVTLLPDTSPVASAVLTNSGNGRETFFIAATASAGDDRIVGIAVDSDGDGRYDPAVDTRIDGRTPELAPSQSIGLFVVLRAATTGTVTLRATAATGSGTAGTVFAGAGDGGGDAITGSTTAQASVTLTLADAPAATAPVLVKSAVVRAPDGSAQAVRGASITYTLVARFPGAVETARVTDPIPAGTTYAARSLTLDDAPLSDARDDDAGEVAAGRIDVALGSQAAGAVRTIRFRVIIE